MPTPPTRVSEGPLASAVAAILADSPADDSTAPPPGALVGLARPGEFTFAVGGLAQTAYVHAGTDPLCACPAVPMLWQTATDAGSLTKIMATTTALMALVDAGEVDLDAPSGRYLPVANLGPAGQASVADLLEHQAGLWEWWPLYLGARGTDALTRAATLPPRYPAGTGRHYSDLGFILLGALVAAVAGSDLATAIGDLVLDPFALTATRYATPVPGTQVAASSPGDAIEREMVRTGVPYPVTGKVEDFAGWRSHTLIGEVNDGNAYHAFGGVSGHAGLFTTATDLLRLATTLTRCLHGEGPLRHDTVTRFLTPGRDPGQALGLRLWQREGGPAFGHTGFPGVAFALLPQHDAALVMVTNRLHAAGTPRPTESMWLQVLAAADNELAHT